MAEREQAQPTQVHYLWPDCRVAWRHWEAVQTQWRVGMAGATGLDYAGVRAYLEEQRFTSRAERREVFACICAAEVATLEAQAECREQKPARASTE